MLTNLKWLTRVPLSLSPSTATRIPVNSRANDYIKLAATLLSFLLIVIAGNGWDMILIVTKLIIARNLFENEKKI